MIDTNLHIWAEPMSITTRQLRRVNRQAVKRRPRQSGDQLLCWEALAASLFSVDTEAKRMHLFRVTGGLVLRWRRKSVAQALATSVSDPYTGSDELFFRPSQTYIRYRSVVPCDSTRQFTTHATVSRALLKAAFLTEWRGKKSRDPRQRGKRVISQGK